MMKILKPDAFKIVISIAIVVFLPVIPLGYLIPAQIGFVTSVDFLSLLSLINNQFSLEYYKEGILINLAMTILSTIIVYIVVALLSSLVYKAIKKK